MNISIKKNELQLLVLIILIAFLIRIIPIFGNYLSFHYDMSRDAFIAEQIWKQHDLKVLGPPTSQQGLYHGVLYYYLIAPVYALSSGDPRLVAGFLGLLNVLAIIPLFLLAKGVLNSQKLAFLTVFLFAFAFESTQYSIWLSDPAPAVLTSVLFFYGLWLWSKGNRIGFVIAALCAALSAQFEFFLIYLFLVMVVYKFLFKAPLTIKDVAVGVFAGLVAISTIIVAVLKFNGLGQTITAFQTLGESKATLDANFTDLLINYINKSSLVFTNNFFPVNVFVGGVLMLVVLYFVFRDKKQFILFGILSNIFIFFFGGHSNIYNNLGIIAPAFLGMAYVIGKVWKKSKKWAVMFVVVIISANLYAIVKAIPKGQYLLVIQPDMTLNNQLALVDQTYLLSEGQPFAINSLTIPLWTNTTWAYLYHYYGYQKYGYAPTFYGNDPIGTLGAEVVKKSLSSDKIKFFIIEPLKGIPGNISDSEFEKEAGNTHLIKEYNYGQIRLQQRQNNNERSSSTSEQNSFTDEATQSAKSAQKTN